MAGNHGARQQKKMAKQKAKKSAKRTKLLMRDSPDPTIRLASAESWPVVQALLGDTLWSNGLGYATIARRDRQGQVVFAVLLVDALLSWSERRVLEVRKSARLQRIARQDREESGDGTGRASRLGQARHGSHRVRAILRFLAPSRLSPRVAVARRDRSLSLFPGIHIRPQRQAILCPGAE